MLTKRQNLLETIHGGKPDRFVNQYEPFKMIMANPYTARNKRPVKGGEPVQNQWGMTSSWPANAPAPFPVHTPDKIVIKDITHWSDYVKAPRVKYNAEEWEPFIKAAEEIDRNEYYAMHACIPGIFEQCHHLMEIQNCLINFYEEPECMHELIEYIMEWELSYAEEACKYLKPDGMFHHDDWGSQRSTFLSPDMFEEFLLPAYKQVYGYYKSHGVELILHHSDTYGETLVPFMIEMGIDIWQGVMTTNNIPRMIEQYGGKISFMGGIDSATIDFPGWTPADVERQVRKACMGYGGGDHHYFIPCASQGLAISTYPGVYEETSRYIDMMSEEMFK